MTRPEEAAGRLQERFRAGDESCFDDVVRLYRKDLYRVAFRVLGSHEDADEAAQEAFVRAWRSMKSYEGRASLKTWLIRIVVNVARSLLTRRKDARPLDPDVPLQERSEGTERMVMRREVMERVRSAVGALPRRQREVVWLRIFSELRYREVAAAMGLTEGAVKAHMHQAVTNLRRRMGSGELTGRETGQ